MSNPAHVIFPAHAIFFPAAGALSAAWVASHDAPAALFGAHAFLFGADAVPLRVRGALFGADAVLWLVDDVLLRAHAVIGPADAIRFRKGDVFREDAHVRALKGGWFLRVGAVFRFMDGVFLPGASRERNRKRWTGRERSTPRLFCLGDSMQNHDELDYDLSPEDAADLTATLAYILDTAIEVFTDISKDPASLPLPDITPKEMARLIRRMKEGTLDTGLSFMEQTELIDAFERALARQRRLNDILGALRQFNGMLHDCDEDYLDDQRDLEKIITHLAKSDAREEGDDKTIREINRARRKAGRSRRK